MIREEILRLAASLGIKKCGFSENAFVALFPYHVAEKGGNISVYARGMDYHNVARARLEPIRAKLSAYGSVSSIHVDNGHLDDRRAAYEAGLGFIGKNGMLICREYGSYFFIGQVTHSLDIERDFPLEETCLQCGRCIAECIGGALSEDGFCIERCVSHISQKRGELTENEKGLILKGGLCWGCDRCQEVCPHNGAVSDTAIAEFREKRISTLKLDELESLSNRDFRAKYGKYAFAWRGKNVLIRNLKIFHDAGNKNEQE